MYLYVTGKSISELIGREAATADEGGADDEDAGADGEAEADEEAEEAEPVAFLGDAISATMPVGWTITEYFDGDYSTMLSEGPIYEGLTGLTVSNPDSEVVFELEAVLGVGGTNECTQYFQFSDSVESYYDEVVATNAEEGAPAPAIVDLTGVDYTSFNFLGRDYRRAETTMYWDIQPATASYDAACGINHGLWEITEIAFDYDGDTSHTYDGTITPGTPAAELLILDDILASFEPMP